MDGSEPKKRDSLTSTSSGSSLERKVGLTLVVVMVVKVAS
jgi:hypothetical protein